MGVPHVVPRWAPARRREAVREAGWIADDQPGAQGEIITTTTTTSSTTTTTTYYYYYY